MAKRRTNRKVVIRYKGREPLDPERLLHALEDIFRPQHVEIFVEADDDEPADRLAEEVLETVVREDVSKALDEQDRQVRQQPKSELETESHGQLKKLPDEDFKVEVQSVPEARYLKRSVVDIVAKGWSLLAKLVPVVKGIKDIFG